MHRAMNLKSPYSKASEVRFTKIFEHEGEMILEKEWSEGGEPFSQLVTIHAEAPIRGEYEATYTIEVGRPSKGVQYAEHRYVRRCASSSIDRPLFLN